jgi:hypothetical protein
VSRYFSRRPARSFWVEDETYDGPVHLGTPQVSDHVVTDTGLLDAYGNTIWRAPDPIGFRFDGEGTTAAKEP